jgi:hypothetical protein
MSWYKKSSNMVAVGARRAVIRRGAKVGRGKRTRM